MSFKYVYEDVPSHMAFGTCHAEIGSVELEAVRAGVATALIQGLKQRLEAFSASASPRWARIAPHINPDYMSHACVCADILAAAACPQGDAPPRHYKLEVGNDDGSREGVKVRMIVTVGFVDGISDMWSLHVFVYKSKFKRMFA